MQSLSKVVLSKEETYRLITESKKGCMQSREKLVNANVRLIHHVTKKFINRGQPLDDLFQIGVIGLIKSIDKFDTSYNVAFSTYSVPMIFGELQRFFRDDGIIKIGRSIQVNSALIKKFREDFFDKNDRKPTLEEISETLNIEYDDVILAIGVKTISSVDDILFENDGDPITLMDIIKSDDDPYGYVDLKHAIEGLNNRNKKIVQLRYFEDRTQLETARALGISQVQISRLEVKIMAQLKEYLEGNTNVLYLKDKQVEEVKQLAIPKNNIIIEEIKTMAKLKKPRITKAQAFALLEKGYQKNRIMEETGMTSASFYNYKSQFVKNKEEQKNATKKVIDIIETETEADDTSIKNTMIKNVIITVDIIVNDDSIIKGANIFTPHAYQGAASIQNIDDIDELFKKIPTWKGKFINFQTEYINGTINVNNIKDYKVNITEY